MVRVFANGLVDRGSITGQVILKKEEKKKKKKKKKKVLDAALLSPQHYNICIKGKVEQSREREKGIEKGTFESPVIITGLVGRVFAKGQGDPDSNPGRVAPKTKKREKKMVLYASLLKTQHYKIQMDQG